MKKLRWLIAALVLFTLVGAACGNDDDSTVGSDKTTKTTASDSSSSSSPPEYTVTAKEESDGSYSFDMPDDIKGGVVKITLDNEGGKEVHDFQLVEMGDHSLDQILTQVATENGVLQPWLNRGVGVGSTAPGSSSSATFELKPNTHYAFFCTESNEEKHISHAARGMSGEFQTGEESGASMPKSSATIETTEYTFAVDGLKSGKNTIAFTNKGSMLHHVAIMPFNDGKTLDDLKAFLASEDQNAAPPVDFEKGSFSAVAGSKQTIVYDLDLAPGHYAILCFMPDPGTAGPPHAMKGMVDEITIR